jgi:hypothetical protein
MHHRTAVALAMLACAARAIAQMPGTPVLQNAWASPGIVGALNVSGGADGTIYAAAASWATASSRLQLSGGLGARSRSGAGTKSVYGLRLAVPFGGASSAIGFGAFAGVGATATGNANSVDSVAATTAFPVGLAIGWRHALGDSRGISLYATPSYLFIPGSTTNNAGLFRAAIGVDVGVARALGLTGGVEFGQSRTRTEGGPTGTLYGVGISYALRHR